MKVYVKRFIALTILVGSIVSCQDAIIEDVALFEAETSLTPEEVLSVVETMTINYPITAVANNTASTTITSDFDLEDASATSQNLQLTFPFDIVVDGETITVTDLKQLRSLIKKYRGKRKPHFVYPISVVLEDNSTLEIEDKEALRAYLDSLDEGVKPVFVYPLSIKIKDQIVEVSNEDELKLIIRIAKGRRPHLVFPLTVTLSGGGTLEIADKEEFKAYLDTLPDGEKPAFVFPISVVKNGETIVVNNQEEFDALVKKPKKGKRPEFVFPISVILKDNSIQEIADLEALKRYYESLDKGVRPNYVFPLSVIKNGDTVVINSLEELIALCRK